MLTITLPINSAKDIGNQNRKWVTNYSNGLRSMLYTERNQIRKIIGDTLGPNGHFVHDDDIEIIKNYVQEQNMLLITEKSSLHHTMYKYYRQKAKALVRADEICTFVESKFTVTSKNRAFAYKNNFKYEELFNLE